MAHYPLIEQWLPINTELEFLSDVRPGLYLVSNYGKVKKLTEKGEYKDLAINLDTRPASVSLLLVGMPTRTRRYGVSTLVAVHFMFREDYANKYVIHIDGNKANNSICNLLWNDGCGAEGMRVMCDYAVYDFIESEPGEIWYPLENCPEYNNIDKTGLYISNHGRLYSTVTRELLGSKETYMTTNLKPINNIGPNISLPIHRMVANTFKPIENSKAYQVNHIDGNKHNNNIDNLEWTTPKGNAGHAFSTKLNKSIGDAHGEAVYNKQDVYNITELSLQGYSRSEIYNMLIVDYPYLTMEFVKNVKRASCRLMDICDYLIMKGYPTLESIISPGVLASMAEDVKRGIDLSSIINIYNMNTPLLKLGCTIAYRIYRDNKFWYDYCTTAIDSNIALN